MRSTRTPSRAMAPRLGLVATVALVAPLLAAVPASSAQAAPAKVVAAAPYPGHGAVATEVTPDGRTLVVKTRAGLTTYQVGPKRIKRLGTTAVRDAGTYEMLLHRGGRYAYLVQEQGIAERLRIYDLRGRAPRLVRTMKLVAQPQYRDLRDAVLTPDGRQLVILTEMFIQTFRLDDPTRPRASARTSLITDSTALAVSPDSKHLVIDLAEDRQVGVYRLGLRRDGRITGDGFAEFIAIPGWEGRQNRTWIKEMVVTPDGGSVLAEFDSFADAGGDGRVSSAIARIRLSDLTLQASAVPGDAGKQLFLADLSNDGRRVFLTSGATTDEPELLPRRALWTDAATLGERHALSGLGDVRSLSVSPGGSTRGRLLAAVVRNDRHLVLEIDAR
jgi:hypothetical protein